MHRASGCNIAHIKRVSIDVMFDIVGSFALAVGIRCFAEKVNIAPGGISGVAIMIKYVFNLPVGFLSLALNIPILILALKFIGKRFTFRTVRSLLISSAVLDLIVTPYFPQYEGERMLGAIFSGVFMGLGLGIIFMRGSTTGGVDIISCLIEEKFPYIPIGKALMLLDCAVLTVSVFVFRNFESVMFGLVSLYCQTRVIDKIVYGGDKGHQVMCVSEKNDLIARRVINELGRSATFLTARGAYSNKDTSVLMCVIRNREYAKLSEIINNVDSSAFVIVWEASQVMGEGFKPIIKDRNNR